MPHLRFAISRKKNKRYCWLSTRLIYFSVIAIRNDKKKMFRKLWMRFVDVSHASQQMHIRQRNSTELLTRIHLCWVSNKKINIWTYKWLSDWKIIIFQTHIKWWNLRGMSNWDASINGIECKWLKDKRWWLMHCTYYFNITHLLLAVNYVILCN